MENGQLALLKVSGLKTSFFTDKHEVKAVNGVDLSIDKHKTLALVGESGSGKSITSLSIMQLIQSPGKIISGEILFDGEDLLQKSASEMRELRGNQIAMVFQEPMTALNPVFTIGEQIIEVFRAHEKLGKTESRKRAIKMLEKVGIPSPEKRMKQYPHELSGGMLQRVMIAIALSCHPQLLIADEPTTALDVTIQSQIMELIKELQKDMNMALLLITHDLGVVAEYCDDVAVMYTGKVVEASNVEDLFENPLHPYTVGLLNSIPRHDVDQEKLEVIPGTVPNPDEIPKGCAFAPRCPFASDICHEKMPELKNPERIEKDRSTKVRCWIYSNEWDGDSEVRVQNE